MQNLGLKILVALAFLIASLGIIFAHESHGGMRYDPYCCTPVRDHPNPDAGTKVLGDCQEIDEKTVKITSQGFEVTLRPGDHRLVTVEQKFVIPQNKARQSTDNKYHICLYPEQSDMRCFYAPPFGM